MCTGVCICVCIYVHANEHACREARAGHWVSPSTAFYLCSFSVSLALSLNLKLTV